MSDHAWTDRLSEYVDGELSADERQQLEAHLAECQQCSAVVEDLRGVLARAQALEDRPPADDLWSGIAERIGATGSGGEVIDLEGRRRARKQTAGLRERRFSFSLPQLVAASLVLAVFSGGSAWLALRAELASSEGRITSTPGMNPSGVLVSETPRASYADERFGTAIAELQRALDESRERLAPETVRTIEENLRTINRAIAQARRALAEDPSSDYLNDHLAETMRQKLEFLRQTSALVAAS
jgi:hypothetical protein